MSEAEKLARFMQKMSQRLSPKFGSRPNVCRYDALPLNRQNFLIAMAQEILKRESNSHDDLLAALKKIKKHEAECKKRNCGYDLGVDEIVEAALVKAKKEKP